MPRNEELIAPFTREEWVFQDDDPERRTIIARLDNGQTIKGRAPAGHLESGLTYRFLGHWTTHPRHGRQFLFNSFTLSLPHGESAVIKYLARMGQGHGLGKARARAIWDAYHEDACEVIRTDPARVATDIKGIDLAAAEDLQQQFERNAALESVTIELNNLLSNRGFGQRIAALAIKEWGERATDTIMQNPYVLMRFSGAGFMRCDALYMELGLDPAALHRQGYCLAHAMQADSEGHTWYPVEFCAAYLRRSVAGAKLLLDEAIEWAIEHDLIAQRTYNGKRYLAPLAAAVAERRVAEYIHQAQAESECTPLRWPVLEGTDEEDGKPSIHQADEAAKATAGILGILAGSPGTGKAQPLDAKILTPTGWTTMGEIRKGDRVIGGDGKPTSVVDVYDRGILPVYRVTFSDGTSTECSEDHLWYTTTRKERQTHKPGAVRTTSQIAATLDRGDGSITNHQIPLVEPIEFEEKDLPIPPYLLGVLLGDGCFIGGYAKLTTPDEFILNEAQCMLPNGVYAKQTQNPIDYSLTGNGGANPLTRVLRELGLMQQKALEKHIPEIYLFSSRESRTALLQGLLDTDGSTDGHNVEFSTSSPQLAEGITFLVHSLGGRVTTKSRIPRYKHNGETRRGALSYRILVMLPSALPPFRLPRKQDKYIPRTKYPPRRYITSVDYIGSKHCKCIAVLNNDGLYITNDCIVTHNTYVLAQIVKTIQASEGAARIAIAAPTGKAAVRATENLQNQGLTLAATTIHRLLKVVQQDGGDGGWAFERNEHNPLELDYLFIDEVSMCDTSLLASLLAARPAGCHVLLIGDPDQLAPVGRGAPLRDLIAAGIPCGHLKKIRRNAGRIVQECARIRDDGRIQFAKRADVSAGENLVLVPRDSAERQAAELEDILKQFMQKGGQNGGIRAAVWDCQVLVPLNEKSELSRKLLNKRLQKLLNPNGETAGNCPFRVNDKIVCLQNGSLPLVAGDSNGGGKAGEAYVANGEIGEVIEVNAGYLIVQLTLPDRLVRVPRGKQSESEDGEQSAGCNFDLAYALSVHKSQGSEWPIVIVMLDAHGGARWLCDKHWLYTAISRAKRLCLCIGEQATAAAMVRKSNMWLRKTFLREDIEGLRFDAMEREWEEVLV
jgi:ATP-dependent exoDNAse (exonuclease V) alpha subunit